MSIEFLIGNQTKRSWHAHETQTLIILTQLMRPQGASNGDIIRAFQKKFNREYSAVFSKMGRLGLRQNDRPHWSEKEVEQLIRLTLGKKDRKIQIAREFHQMFPGRSIKAIESKLTGMNLIESKRRHFSRL